MMNDAETEIGLDPIDRSNFDDTLTHDRLMFAWNLVTKLGIPVKPDKMKWNPEHELPPEEKILRKELER